MPGVYQTPRMHGIGQVEPDNDHGNRYLGAVGHWGDTLFCGPNAAREAAWHNDMTGKMGNMVGIPVKLHGAREQSIGVKFIWGLNGPMYKHYKMWFPRKQLDKALADPRVVVFDIRWTTTPDRPRALQDMRGASRLLPIIFDNTGAPRPIPEGYWGVLGVMIVHMGRLELRRLDPGAFDLTPLLPASIRQTFPSYDSIIAPNAFDVPAGIFDAGPLRSGPMLPMGEIISIGGTFKDGTIDGIDFVEPDGTFGPPARHSGVVYDVIGDNALIYDALSKDALAALLRRPRLKENTVLSAEGSLVLTYRTRTVALTNILGRLEIVTPRLVVLRKGCTSDRLAESQVMLGEDNLLRLINPPPDDVIHQTVARKTRRGTLENVQGTICEKLAREVSELHALPAYATFVVERVMPHEFFSLPGVREKMEWLERSTSMDTELTMAVTVKSVNEWRDILGPTFNDQLVWKALAPRVTAVLGKKRQRPERLPTYYQLTGGKYDLKPKPDKMLYVTERRELLIMASVAQYDAALGHCAGAEPPPGGLPWRSTADADAAVFVSYGYGYE